MRKITLSLLLVVFSYVIYDQPQPQQNEDFLKQQTSKEEAREMIKAKAMSMVKSHFEASLKSAVELTQTNPEGFVNRPATCFAPDTDPAVVEAFYRNRTAINNSLGSSPEAHNSRFNLANRWFSTATDGGGLGQGDVTTLTWSYVPDGTSIGNGGCGLPDAGTFSSDFISFFNGIYGSPTTPGDFTTAPWHNIFVTMFNSWSNVSGLIFVYEPNDDGATVVSSPGALGLRGDMRISGHLIDGNSNVLACNYFPNSGDMIIDTGDSFFSSNSGTGTTNTLTHEIGHGLGLLHVCPINQTKLMEPFVTNAFLGPQEDDILATNRFYGDPDGTNDSSATATLLGTNNVPTTYSRMQRSIDDNSDTDYFSFTVNRATILSGTLTPTGTTYLSGVQNNNGSCSSGSAFDALTIADLMLEVLDTNGTTILATAAANGPGVAELVQNVSLPTAGNYYIRVSQQGGSVNNVQMYNLNLDLAAGSNDSPPNAVCTNFTVQLDASGNASILPENVDGGSNDPEGSVTLSVSPDTFDCSNIGTNSVTLTVTDTMGQTDSCVAIITIVDPIPLLITCPSNSTQNNDAGECGAIVTYAMPTVTDNCSGNTINQTAGLSSGSMFPAGTTTNTFVVTDASGNEATCSFDVTVVDTEAPIAVCQNITVQLGTNGEASIIGTDIDGGSTDTCGITSLTVLPNTFDCSNIGTNTVMLTVTDGSGNSANCSAIVTIADTLEPEMSCPSNSTQNTDAGTCTAIVTYIMPIANDNCSGTTIVQQTEGLPSGSMFPVGTTTNTFMATDASGNEAICSFDVTVMDTESPVAVCQNITIQLDTNNEVSIIAADVDGGSTDACGVSSLTVIPNTFDCSNVGANTVTLTVTDVNGNSANCSAIVTVIDVTNPGISCPSNITRDSTPGDCGTMVTYTMPTVTDNCSGNTITQTTGLSSGSMFPVGTTTNTFVVTDGSGNEATCSFDITIVDIEAPIAVCQNVTVLLDANGEVSIVGTNLDGGSSDACGIESFVASPNTFNCSNIGVNTVTLTVTDGTGNSANCSAIVTVIDTFQPEITCPTDMTVDPGSDNMYTVPDYAALGDVIVMDNCIGSVVITQDPVPGTLLESNNYTVTSTATDPSGNSVTCTFQLTVNDVLGNDVEDSYLSGITLHPNPITNYVSLSNPKLLELESLSVYDLTGRLVMQENLEGMELEKTINVSVLQRASYIFIIKSKKGQLIRQIIKE